jgi:hypothetical protein
MRVSFKLSMPGKASWNGKWSGENDNYQVVKDLSLKTVNKLNLKECSQDFSYRWEDGWRASIEVRLMEKGEKLKPSKGFCGYEWMIKNIVDYGSCYDEKENTCN